MSEFALADEAPEDLEMEIFFAPAETVTSAARHVQPLDLSPVSITVLTREDIETAGARSLPDALRMVPGMDINQVKPLWKMVGVRGLTYINSDSILLLVDDRDVTFEFFGFPMWAVQHFSMDDVERIEVIRGPGSALYGANAFSGVVHVITRKPGDGPRAQASLRGGETGSIELTGRVSESFGPLSLSISGGLERQDLWTMRDTNALDVNRGHLKGLVDLGKETRLHIDSGVYTGAGPFYTNVGEGHVHQGLDYFAAARFEHEELVIGGIYDLWRFDVDFGMRLLYPDLDNLELARLPRTRARVDKTVWVARHGFDIFHNRLSYGAEYVYNHYHAGIMTDPDHQEHRVGLYLQDEIDLQGLFGEFMEGELPALLLTVGLRFDYNSVTRQELSPRASIVYAVNPDHTLRFGYSHAFLKPTFFETSIDVQVEDVSNLGLHRLSMATPDLDNETVDSLQLGYNGSFLDGSLILRLELAYNWYRNSIWFDIDEDQIDYIEVGGLRIPRLDSQGFHFINHPSGYNGHNVELEIILKPTDRSRIFFQAGYRQILDSDTGEWGLGEPVWRLAAGADLSGRLGWVASLRAFYTHSYTDSYRSPEGALAGDVLIDLPAWWFLNARFAWKLSEKPAALTVGIEAFNLLDFRFREFGGLNGYNQADYGGERLGRRITLFIQGEI